MVVPRYLRTMSIDHGGRRHYLEKWSEHGFHRRESPTELDEHTEFRFLGVHECESWVTGYYGEEIEYAIHYHKYVMSI